ncbi:MAG TPA: nicotinate-nucleotide--dimethylbenzimidazole phosphoribosyltransferase [Terracidiphilus sp.]|nr:nicotinate-nucleotide--dimethylbenzimidazole phosphoribosyltransferase [Terracidiphilus sp.]
MIEASSSTLRDIIAAIRPCEPQHIIEAARRLDLLTKPVGSLGRLEAIATQMFSIFAGEIPQPLRRAVHIFAADHGVTAEGVSAYPAAVTAQMVRNFLKGGAAINVLARLHHAALIVVDVGVDAEFDDAPLLRRMKVRRSSRNMLHQPAMSAEELSRAIEAGIKMAQTSKERGESLVAVGEMGIGNTTAASAITSILTHQPVSAVTGSGTGLDSEGRNRKVDVIRRSLELHFGEETSPDPIELLRCVGGLEIAAMTGFILGAAANRIAIVCDGFISTAAAAVAHAVAPQVSDYLFAGHCSEEPGHRFLLHALGLTPLLSLGMRLGEGTGAVLAMPLIESSVRLLNEMATFTSAGVSAART